MKDQKGSSKSKHKKNRKNAPWKWIVTIFLLTILISGTFSFFSNTVLDSAGLVVSLILLLAIVLIGILFDIIGVAVTAADVQSIHGMASRRVKGASVAADLIKNANKVSSICNDVIGDICGIISGAATAVIAVTLLMNFSSGFVHKLLPIVLSAVVAALTVTGKAVGKIIALNKSTEIIFAAGRFIAFFKRDRKNRKKR